VQRQLFSLVFGYWTFWILLGIGDDVSMQCNLREKRDSMIFAMAFIDKKLF